MGRLDDLERRLENVEGGLLADGAAIPATDITVNADETVIVGGGGDEKGNAGGGIGGVDILTFHWPTGNTSQRFLLPRTLAAPRAIYIIAGGLGENAAANCIGTAKYGGVTTLTNNVNQSGGGKPSMSIFWGSELPAYPSPRSQYLLLTRNSANTDTWFTVLLFNAQAQVGNDVTASLTFNTAADQHIDLPHVISADVDMACAIVGRPAAAFPTARSDTLLQQVAGTTVAPSPAMFDAQWLKNPSGGTHHWTWDFAANSGGLNFTVAMAQSVKFVP